MNPTRFSLRRPLTVLVAVVAIALGAGLALQRMNRDIFPPLGVPTIYVAQPYGGMDPAQMEGFLAYFYEYHFLYITGIEHVESKSIQGASLLKLQFHPGTDMAQALSETIGYVNRSRAFMPPGTVPPFVTRFDAGSVPVGYLTFSTTNATRTVAQMQDAALNMVRPLFATLPGVSAPPPFGGSARTIVVNANPGRLRAHQISADELVQALAQANLIAPSGNLAAGEIYPMVPVNGVVKNIRDLEAVPLRVTPQGSVHLRDVATVEDGSDLVTSYAFVNGRRTVYIPVTKRADASTLAVVGRVRENLPKFQAAVPEDVRVGYEFDQSPVVEAAIRGLTREGLLGAGLTGLAVLVFLRDLRSALIVVINIPLALMAALLALWLGGEAVNLMTLGGLALAVGILVDEASVTMENIHTHLARGSGVARAALDATLETAAPRLVAMLCVVAVFIPVFFMTGPARALFAPLAAAVGFSMAASYILSSTLVPVLSAWWLRPRHAAARGAGGPGFAARVYGVAVRGMVGLRWLLAPGYLVACAAAVWMLAPRLGVEIFPAGDSGQLALRLRAPPGTRPEGTETLALRAVDLIGREAGPDAVELSMGLAGVHAPNYPVNLIHLWNGGTEEAWLAVKFRPTAGVAVPELRERLRGVFARELPEARVSFEPADIVNRVMSFGSPTPIEVAVAGPDLAASRRHAELLLERLRALPFLRDLQIAQNFDAPTVEVQVQREKAGLLGVRVSDVARSLAPVTASSRFTLPNYWADPKSGISYNLQVQVPQSLTASLEDLANVPVSAGPGRAVPLRSVATLTPATAVGQYERYNMARVASVTANLHGIDLGAAARAVRKAIEETGPPPPKSSVQLRGQVVPLEELMRGFRSGLGITVITVFLLLAANFQSIRLSLAVVTAVPAALAGGLAALWATGTTLNIQSAMGLIMAVGVAVANAILLVTFAERARIAGRDARQAAVEGAVSRLRPILMTSLAMIAGMAPLALGHGAEGGQTAPLGRAVIGGLSAATVATLLVLPAAFALLRGRASRRSRSLDPDDPAHLAPAAGPAP